jgi:NAD(P)H-dependent FMN reductase
MNIEIISGSPRKNSMTNRVVLFLKAYLQQVSQHNINIIDVRDWDIPVLETAWMSPEKVPASLQELGKRMFSADAFIMVTPEYNGSYSSALKNLFDHFPKQSHKAFAIVTASDGAFGGIRASQQLQLLINALFGIGSPYMLVVPGVNKKFDEQGNLLDPHFQKSVDIFVTELLWLAESIRPVVEPAELM